MDGSRTSRVAAWAAFVIAVVIAAQGAAFLVLGFDRAAGVTTIGLGLLTAYLLFRALRSGERMQPPVPFVLPLVILGWAAVLPLNDRADLAVGYLAVGALSVLATWLARPDLTGADARRTTPSGTGPG